MFLRSSNSSHAPRELKTGMVRCQRFSADIELCGTTETGPRGQFQTHTKECAIGWHPRPSSHAAPYSPPLLLPCRAPRCKGRLVLALPRSPVQGQDTGFSNKGGGCSAVKLRTGVCPAARGQYKQAPVFAAVSRKFNLNLSSVEFGATSTLRQMAS